MKPQTQMFEGGFPDAVFDAQLVFRAVMDAMANPGRVVPVDPRATPPAPLSPLAASIAATLFDQDTIVWCDKPISKTDAAVGWLRFQTGMMLSSEAGQADFALVTDIDAMPSFEAFAKGTAEYPDQSTTLILQVEGFDGAEQFELRGPGIEESALFAPSHLPRLFIEQWAANRAAFPRGIDLIFAGKDRLAALPRTTRVTRRES